MSGTPEARDAAPPGSASAPGPPGPGSEDGSAEIARPADLTPMMRQYRQWKRRYPDYLLLFRLGDFYEAFYEDAVVAARVLNIALTSRQKGPDAIPMAGVPHHAVDSYIGRLLAAGLKVAVCDQVEAASPRGRRLLRREVVRLVTPGTVTDTGYLDRGRNNFLAALVTAPGGAGVALVDVTTADFLVAEGSDPAGLVESALLRRPAELLVPPDLPARDPLVARFREAGATVTVADRAAFAPGVAEERLRAHFGVATLAGLGLTDGGLAARAAGAVLAYLQETHPLPPAHLTRVQPLVGDDHLVLDEPAVRHLELVENLADRTVRGSLLGVLDCTRTPMGARLLRQWVLRPLRDPEAIDARLTAVEALAEDPDRLAALRELLGGIGDLQRLASRVALGVATPRDLAGLRAGLRPLPTLRAQARQVAAPLVQEALEGLDGLEGLRQLLEEALVDDPPASFHEGPVIRESYSAALADIRREAREARGWIAGLEARERQRTGIATLRVRFHRVLGYGIEVPKAHLGRVPPDYLRRQTLVGAERFVTPELREREAVVLGAEERARRLEAELFDELRRAVARETDRVGRASQAVALLDVLAALAQRARERGYVRPTVDRSARLEIRDGRHPVLELRPEGDPFVPNDLLLDGEDVTGLILTGPNMAGKSTYMRQVALIVILAQLGSFVPARAARIGVVDRIFARIGAQDDLLRGRSTFLVEMSETARILRQATSRSLVLLDEIGRGTSTYDGLAIAWAVAEYLHDRCPGAKMLFATHYHELVRLAAELRRVRNVHVAVREHRGGIVFLYKVQAGATDRSYGIHVARLAGLPEEVVARAREILTRLEQRGSAGPPRRGERCQLALFPSAPHPVLETLAGLDPDAMTPLEALQTLHRLQQALRADP